MTSMIAQITSVQNLTRAWQHVRGNIRSRQRRSSRGVDDVTIEEFERNWAEAMELIAHELRTGTFRPLPPKHVFLPKQDGGERQIGILSIRDRIGQRAVYQVLQAYMEPRFLECSYGYRINVRISDARYRVERYYKQGMRWVVRTDIENCFGSLDHKLLLSIVEQHISEQAVLDLIEKWLEVGVMENKATEDAGSWLDTSSELLDQVVDWGTEAMLQAEGYAASYSMSDYESLLGEQLIIDPAERPDHLRQHAKRGLMRNLTMLGLTYGKPAVSGLRRLAPHLQARKVGRYMGLAGVAAVAALPLVDKLRQERQRGALQGGALSPLLANIYLDQFDRAMFKHGYAMIRYADDMLLLGPDQASVEVALRDAQAAISRLRMKLNSKKTGIYSFAQGFTFLGYDFQFSDGSEPSWGSFRSAERALRQMQQHQKRRRKER